MQLGYVGPNRCDDRLDVALQNLNCSWFRIIEDKKALDVERRHPLVFALEIELLSSGAQLFDEDERRAGFAAFVSASARKSLNDCEAKLTLLREGAANSKVTGKVLAEDFVLASRMIFELDAAFP